MLKKTNQLLTIFFLLTIMSININAATILYPGDVVVLSINGDSETPTYGRGFSFMPLVNLEEGTIINFTDYGWSDVTGAFITNTSVADAFIHYTAPAGGITAGTVIRCDQYNYTNFTFDYTYSGTGSNPYLNTAGLTNSDELLIFTGSRSSPTFIYAVSFVSTTLVASGWATNLGTDGVNSGGGSALPGTGNSTVPDLIDDETALSFNRPDTSNDNSSYAGPTTAATKAVWQERIRNYANWTYNDAIPIPTPLTGPFVVTGEDTTPPTLSSVGHNSVAQTTVNLSATSNEAGNMYYVISTSSSTPTNTQVKGNTVTNGVKNGSSSVTANVANTFNISGLTPNTTYYYYIVAQDNIPNVSIVSSGNFTTQSVSSSPATNLAVSDVSDYDGGVDLRVTFTKAADETKVGSYRLIAVKTANVGSFDLATANGLNLLNYVTVTKTGSNISATFDPSSNAADGTRITNGVSYTVFVLSVADGTNASTNVLSTGSAPITLVDSIPSVNSITPAVTSATSATETFTVTFSESVTGVDITDFTLTKTGTANGTISGISGSSSTYTVTVNSITGTGTLRLDLNASGTGIKDSTNTPIPAGYTSGGTHTVDRDAPTVQSITPSGTAATSATETFTVTFSESVTGVDTSDFTLTKTSTADGTISGISGSGASYTISVNSITGTGTLRLDLNASGTSIADSATNAIPSGFTSGTTHAVDRVSPSVSTLSPTNGATGVSQTNDFIITFSENISKGTGDITIKLKSNDFTVATILNTNISASGTQLTIPHGSLGANTQYYINIPSTLVLDSAGNNYTGISDTTSWVFTTAAGPTVSSITQSGSAQNSTTETFTVTFNQSVTGVDISDFTLTKTNTAQGTISGISGSGTTYTVSVNTISGTGTIRLDLNSSGTGIVNGSSVAIAGGFTSGSVHSVDTVAPSLQSVTPAVTAANSASVIFTVTFSEVISGLDVTDFSLTNTSSASGIVRVVNVGGAGGSGGGGGTDNIFLVTVDTIAGTGTIRLDLKSSGTGIIDNAGNAISGGFTSGTTHTVDRDSPTFTVTGPSNGTYKTGQVLTFNAAASEIVSITGTPYITFTSGSTSKQADYVSGSSTTTNLVFQYTVLANDLDTDGITVSSPIVGTIKDTATNNALLTFTPPTLTSVLVDAVPPTVSTLSPLNNATGIPTSGNLVITFNENIAKGTGAVTINRWSNNSNYATIQSTSISVTGTQMTIPYSGLALNSKCYVNIPSTLVTDTAGNSYGGISDNSTWVFTTTSNLSPVLGGTFTTNGTVNDNSTTTPFSNVTVTDSENNNTSITITYTAANGTLSGTGITGNAGNYTLTSDTPATVESNLRSLVFTPTNNQVAPGNNVVTTFTLTPSDAFSTGSANSTTQITAASINNAPVLLAVSPTIPGLTRYDTEHAGKTVSYIINTSISDVDFGALKGIAVTEVTNGTGKWQYSTNNGTSWSDITAISTTSALLLTDTDKVRFVPQNIATGTIGTLRYRAWDRIANLTDTSSNGGTSSFSTVYNTMSVTVTGYNDVYIDINFSKGVYGANDSATPVNKNNFALTYTKNAGNSSSVVISSVKKPDSGSESSASALTGGETVIRAFLTITGTPNGFETIEIKPANGTSIYDQARNPMTTIQSTGVKTLKNKNIDG